LFRYLRELSFNIIREIERGGLDPNTVEALHFRLDWLQGLKAWLVQLYGIDEQIVNLIWGARNCLIGRHDSLGVSSPAIAFTLAEKGFFLIFYNEDCTRYLCF